MNQQFTRMGSDRRSRQWQGAYPGSSTSKHRCSFFEDLDLYDEEGLARDDIGHAAITVRKVRRDPELPRAPYTHPLDTLEQTIDQVLAVDSQIRHHGVTIVFETCAVDETARVLPPDGFAFVQPHLQSHGVGVVPQNQGASSWLVREDFNTGAHDMRASTTCETQITGDLAQRVQHELDVRVEIDAELLGSLEDILADHAACEGLVLQFLPHRRDLDLRE